MEMMDTKVSYDLQANTIIGLLYAWTSDFSYYLTFTLFSILHCREILGLGLRLGHNVGIFECERYFGGITERD